MKRLALCLVLLAFIGAGCGGVYMNPTYSLILDKAVAVSDEAVKRGATLSDAEFAPFGKAMLKADNKYLHSVQDARDQKPVKP